MPYEVVDYTNMNSVTTFNRGAPNAAVDDIQTGGFGDFVDYVQSQSRVCISHDYTDIITCWDLTDNNAGPPGGNIVIHRKFRTGWPIRALTGYYESPYFAVCGRKWIKVYNTWDVVATVADPGFNTQHTAIWEENAGSQVGNDFNHQIWDLVTSILMLMLKVDISEELFLNLLVFQDYLFQPQVHLSLLKWTMCKLLFENYF
jgi:hypothetical protein